MYYLNSNCSKNCKACCAVFKYRFSMDLTIIQNLWVWFFIWKFFLWCWEWFLYMTYSYYQRVSVLHFRLTKISASTLVYYEVQHFLLSKLSPLLSSELLFSSLALTCQPAEVDTFYFSCFSYQVNHVVFFRWRFCFWLWLALPQSSFGIGWSQGA